MRALSLAVVLATSWGIAGCGSDKTAVMPDVAGKKLDVAKSAIKDAGFENEVKVSGGGAFGVVTESNWEVCTQSPASGAAVSAAPQLTVDRSCGEDAKPNETSEPNETSKASEAPPQTSEPDAAESSAPAAEPVLTKANNEALAALLAVSDPGDETIAPFVAEYSDRTIEFDGYIAYMANHGDYDTRYDILVSPGNKDPESTVGPNFKFEDVSVADLNLTGADIPDTVGEGDRFRFVARIIEFNQEQELLFLEPVSTRTR